MQNIHTKPLIKFFIMLKKTLMTVLAAAAVTACSQVETTSFNPNSEGTDLISFSPVVPKATRGTATTIAGLQDNGFYVVAYGNNSFYFNRQIAAYYADGKDENGPGFYLPEKYSWPSYELTFAAWYPATLPADGSGGRATAYDKDNTEMPGQYVSQPQWNDDGSGLKNGQEIRGFVPATAHATQTDIVIARTKAAASTHKGQPVTLNFRHILSQVSFRAKKLSGEQLRIEIKEIELRNIPSKGNFSFRKDDSFTTDGNVTSDTSNPQLIPNNHWEIVTPTGTNLNYSDAAGNNVNLQRYKHSLTNPVILEPVAKGTEGTTYELLGEGGNMLLIPQSFEGYYFGSHLRAWNETGSTEGAYLALKMKVWRKVEAPDPEADPDKNWTLIFPANDDIKTDDEYGYAAVGIVSQEGCTKRWEPGRHYVYTLNFTDEGVGKHDPENPDKGGDDILGDYIWFTVTVDDWIPTPQTPKL